MDKPLVSVSVLAYNHEQYIAQAIESVISQKTDFSFEVIIGEDCSTDNTLAVIRQYEEKYPHIIRVLASEQNIGARRNRLRNSDACRGEYIAFCEGDDYWIDPEKLQKQLNFMIKNSNLSLSFHSVYIEDAQTGELTLHERKDLYRLKGVLVPPETVILGVSGIINLVSVMVRQEVFKNRCDWFVNAPVGDYSLLLSALGHGEFGKLDTPPMAVYRKNVPNSWTMKYKEKNVEEVFSYIKNSANIRKSFDEWTNYQYTRYIKQITSRRYRSFYLNNSMDYAQKIGWYKDIKKDLLFWDRRVTELSLLIDFPPILRFYHDIKKKFLRPYKS
jgi:glycosyltransferase involved in cell wall biosynthesis